MASIRLARVLNQSEQHCKNVYNYERCATHETHSYEDEMEETVNLADLESAEIFGGEVIQ